MSGFDVLALLIVGHALADYPLQGDFLARAKNPFNPIPGVPWYQALGAHAIIHGGFVGVITGSILLGTLETLLHFGCDYGKCAGRMTYNQDQAFHIALKVVFAATYVGLRP